MNWKINTLRKKIGLGFALIVGVLIITIGITRFQLHNISNTTEKLEAQYQPSMMESANIQIGVNHSIATVRGVILLQDDSIEKELDTVWSKEIRPSFNRLSDLSMEWTDTDNIQLLSRLQTLLDKLQRQQRESTELAAKDSDLATERIETEVMETNKQIRDIIAQLTVNLEHLASKKIQEGQAQLGFLANIEWILLGVSLLLGFVLAVRTSRSISKPIDKVIFASNKITEGNLDSKVSITGPKEIETLGNTFETMRRSLKQKEENAQIYDWLTSGQNNLNNVVRGDQDVEELADNIINFVTQYLEGTVGALYLIDETENKLTLTGTYAFTDGKKHQFAIGEGLIGQTAADKEIKLIRDFEDDRVSIISSVIEATPKHIIAAPFLVDGDVLGVIEVGKLDNIEDHHIEFLDNNSENIGIAINSAIARRRINNLLEETQQQSEELQQQQEELEQNNEELEEQSQNLKEQQEELQANNEELEEQTQMLEQKNEALEKAHSEIERKAKQLEATSKYKSEFLANMSHELRTPLNSLLILGKDLIKNKNDNLGTEELESAEIIVKSGRDLLTLINEILDLSKVEAGKMDLNISKVNIEELTDDLYGKFKKQAEQKGLGFITNIDATLPDYIRTDRQRLEQIIKNLLSNAIKFTEEGEVTLRLNRNAGDYLSVSVSDTGIGISEEKRDEIFKAFHQADAGTARKYGGTGLGLSISKELAELLDGSIEVESTPGEGSTFTVSIPIQSEEKKSRKPAKKVVYKKDSQFIDYPTIEDQREVIKSSDHTILIIEDDDDFAKVLANQAGEKGFKFLAASTGEDGLLLAKQYKPTAIILDLDLPGIDGHMVLRELKGDPNLRHIPVHIISAVEKTLDPIKSGAVQYFTKPVTKKQLDDAFGRIEDFIKREMKTLLVVEDDKTLRKSIVKLLGNGDVKCVEASNGKNAIEEISKNPVDCIVLDIGLPDMNGFDFINQLEQQNGDEIPPIIVYTGKELSKEETEKLQEYAETVIVKGIKSEERLLDETALFLHRTVKNLPKEKQEIITKLYDKELIFKNKKILLVDDDMRNVFALSKVLKEKGMNIIKADNGRVALQKLKEEPDVDLVLMDIMMPEMDGYECIQEIRKQKEFKNLPVVALTAKAMKNDRQKCLDAGADDYISKPVDVERLLSLMRIWIEK
jgi:CheY-like chemotaxis protein/CHASE3 domain sensor protein